LERHFAIPAGVSAQLMVKRFNHEFGSYREVCVSFDSESEAAIQYAYQVEVNCPQSWDETARYELYWYKKKADILKRLELGAIQITEIPAEFQSISPPSGKRIGDDFLARERQ